MGGIVGIALLASFVAFFFWFRRAVDHIEMFHQPKCTGHAFFNGLGIEAQRFSSLEHNDSLSFSRGLSSQGIWPERGIDRKGGAECAGEFQIYFIL